MARVELYGQLVELNLDTWKISTNLERVKLYMEANRVVDEKGHRVVD